jgi:hypothetical protein
VATGMVNSSGKMVVFSVFLLQQPLKHMPRTKSFNEEDMPDTAEERRGCYMINDVHELVPHDPKVETIVQENRQATEEALAEDIIKITLSFL